MPLVDYASSDEGSEDDCEGDNKEVVQTNVKYINSNETCATVNDNNPNCDTNGKLFSSLPKPKKTFSFPEDNKLSKLLLNKSSLTSGKKESVQISVPSVSDFDDDSGQPAAKKVKPSAKGTGLFSILPPPKNTSLKLTSRHLVPQAVSKNQVKQTLHKSETNKCINNMMKGSDEDEEDDDILVGSSFFGSSLGQQNSHPDTEGESSEKVIAVESASSFKVDARNSFEYESNMSEQQYSDLGADLCLNVGKDIHTPCSDPAQTIETVKASDNPLKLDEKALQILCGNKKKRHQMPMNIIDLSGEEVLPDSKEWLLKQFTEERRGRSHSHKKSYGPSSQSRRKHQITYLAYQAKEQELELQNQWALNRMSRKQTQSKYGF